MLTLSKIKTTRSSFVAFIACAVIIAIGLLYGLNSAYATTTYSFSGILKDSTGAPVGGGTTRVTLRDANNVSFADTSVGNNGAFSLAVPAGMYSLQISGFSNSLGNFSYSQDASTPSIDLTSANVTQDLTIPVTNVTVNAYNPQGYPASHVQIGGHSSSGSLPITLYPGAPVAEQSGYTKTRSVEGNTATFKVITGTKFSGTDSNNSFCSYTNPSVQLIYCNTTPLTVTSNTTVNIPYTPAVTNEFSGVLEDQNGTDLADITVTLEDAYGNRVSRITASNGSFTIPVQPGVYSLMLAGSTSATGAFAIAQPLTSPTIDLTSGNVVQNLTLPIATINFTAYDELGNPVSPNNTRIRALSSKTSGSSTVSLYTGGPDFNQIESFGTNGWSVPTTQGTGSFKTILGAKFTGVDKNNDICTYAYPSFVLIACSGVLLDVGSGTNSAAIYATP